MKNCEAMQVLMSLHLDGEITAEENEILTTHINECAECAECFENFKSVTAKVRLIPEVELPEDFHEDFMKKLRDKLSPIEFMTPKDIKQGRKKGRSAKSSKFKAKYLIRALVSVAALIGCTFVIGQIGDSYLNENNNQASVTSGLGYESDSGIAGESRIGIGSVDTIMNADTADKNSSATTGTSPASYTASKSSTGEAFVRRYSIILNVDDYDKALELINTLPGSNTGLNADYGTRRSAHLTRSIDQANYQYGKDFLRGLGDVTNENESEYRVSTELIDLESRLAAKEDEIDRLLAILEKSSSLNFLTAVERRVSEAERERDNIKSQILRYNSQVANCVLSISVNYIEPEAAPPPISAYTERLREHFDKSIEFLQNLFENIAVFAAMIFIPAALVLVLILIALAIFKRKGGIHEKG